MTPPCPNCGTVFFLGPVDDAGWRSVSISESAIFEQRDDGAFIGHEYCCAKCGERWRVPASAPHDPVDLLDTEDGV